MDRPIRPTPRGTALLGVGGLTTLAGVLLGVQIMVQVGVLLLLTVGVSVGWMVREARESARGRLSLSRRVVPHPMTVGQQATVHVELVSTAGRHRLDRIQVAERAARELSGPTALRARVQRAADRLVLTYTIAPQRRGRWVVGPLEVQRRDVFGTVGWRGPLGEPMRVAVRPQTAPLNMSNRSSSTDVDRAAAGARTPAADDSSLRDYRTGDDLRRVHWRSSARRGELVVRQDERAGRRPSSVVLDLPLEPTSAEWSISVAASIALALVRAGHHVRMLGGGVVGASTDHHQPDTHGHAVEALLDQTVDLEVPADRHTRERWFRTATDTLTAQGGGTELIFAVVGALDADELAAIARVGDTHHGWIMVRTGRPDGSTSGTPDEERTLHALRRAGWTACAVRPGEDITVCWERLLASGDPVGAVR